MFLAQSPPWIVRVQIPFLRCRTDMRLGHGHGLPSPVAYDFLENVIFFPVGGQRWCLRSHQSSQRVELVTGHALYRIMSGNPSEPRGNGITIKGQRPRFFVVEAGGAG